MLSSPFQNPFFDDEQAVFSIFLSETMPQRRRHYQQQIPSAVCTVEGQAQESATTQQGLLGFHYNITTKSYVYIVNKYIFIYLNIYIYM